METESQAAKPGAFEPYIAPPTVADGKNKDIEVLRAVAISSVVAYHAHGTVTPALRGEAAELFAAGNFARGVDLFFVISGFVIARTLLPRLQRAVSRRQRISVALAFWVRRVFRVLPTAWLWLALILIITAAFKFNTPVLDFETNVDATVAAVLLVANIRFAEAFGGVVYGATPQFWSLSLEERFYLLLPLLALLSGRRWLPHVLLLLLIGSALWAHQNALFLYLLWTETLLLGVLIAIWSEQKSYARAADFFGKIPLWAASMLSIAAVVSIGLARMVGPYTPLEFVLLLLSTGAAVTFASFNRDALCPPGLWRNVSLWIGSRSYALYVIHLPLFVVIQDLVLRVAPKPWSIWVTVCTLSFALAMLAALAELNYRLVEMPLRRLGMRLAAKIATPSSPAEASRPA